MEFKERIIRTDKRTRFRIEEEDSFGVTVVNIEYRAQRGPRILREVVQKWEEEIISFVKNVALCRDLKKSLTETCTSNFLTNCYMLISLQIFVSKIFIPFSKYFGIVLHSMWHLVSEYYIPKYHIIILVTYWSLHFKYMIYDIQIQMYASNISDSAKFKTSTIITSISNHF